MTIQKLELVMWRLRKGNPDSDTPTNIELRRAIMYEVGTDERTYIKTRKALIRLGWMRTWSRTRVKLTNKDMVSG